ncbi:MAG TPA: glycoside hydrolase family 38 C-terminal domain-containing protein [Fimbriimonadaceae bacterium]|nr:glycoside hydrolase family 38 C-terminal domain-containing protein [Fimbriimonadaceae bacterium]
MRATALATAFLALCLAPGLSAAGGDSGKNPRHNNPNDHQPRDLSKGNTLFVVPYAHLDTQWRWAYPQVIREYIANTLHANFKLIEKYPNYTFNFSGSRRYEMMKEYYPAEYQKLKEYVKEGRWFPCGSSVDENDANVPSGESIVRHVLYGNHFFRREFGVASEEYMLPDCFGFPYSLPSILAYCGIKQFSTQKLTWNSANGIPFKVGTWEGPDGKSVVAALDPGGYGSRVDEDLSQNTSWLARIQNTGKLSGAYVDYKYYGTGDQGGGPTSDSVDWVEKSIASNGPITVVSAHADELVRSLTPQQIAKLPHYKGELLLVEHSAGSVSSEAMMKRWNRKNELLAQGAEEASVAAMLFGGAPYPGRRIYNAWDLVLGSQMHDMLPGTSIPKAYEFCWNDELLAQNQFGAVETDALGAISQAMDTRGRGQAIVVYNPLSIPRTDTVMATVPMGGNVAQVYAPDGTSVPTQVLGRDGEGLRILFRASVPSTGFVVFKVRSELGSLVHFNINRNLWATARTIENKNLKVTIDAAGDISSIYDKVNHREVLKAPMRLDFQYENPKQFPAWNMDWEDQQKPPYDHVHGPAKIHVVENGPVRATIEVERETRGSKFVQDISLDEHSDSVRVENKIDWQTKETALKASIPLANGNPMATYDLALGAIQRGNNEPRKYEVPQHEWFNVDRPDKTYGVGVLNDSKYGSDKPDDNTVRLTMIYTPGVRGGFSDQATQDFGRHDIVFAIAPHKGDWRQGKVAWEAKRLNQPLRAFTAPSHPGRLGKSFSLVTTNTDQVEVQAIKKAEDSNQVVVRLRELTGSPAHNVKIGILGGVGSWQEVNGQEQPIGPRHHSETPGIITTDVPGFSLKSFAITIGREPAKVAATQSSPVALPFDTDVASTDANPADGAFDKHQHALSAEQLPKSLEVDGVEFKFGRTMDGAKNAVSAHGQKIALPAGYSRVYLVAASANGDTPAKLTVGNRAYSVVVQNWGGYVGQWDNRLWASDPGPDFTNYTDMVGLVPGYVKPSEVAWFASHTHIPTGNTYYQYSYLYKYGFDIPKGARTMTLPNDSAIKVLAVTVAKDGHDQVRPAAPLADTLKDHVPSGRPVISPSGGSFNDITQVTISSPLYHNRGGLHYTLDGSNPTAESPTYNGPISINDPTTIKAVEVDQNGHAGEVAIVRVDVHDTTPPKAVSATAIKALGLIRIEFSEPVDQVSAQAAVNYGSGTSVVGDPWAQLGPDGKTVTLKYSHPIDGDSISIHGVKDRSLKGNVLVSQTLPLVAHGAVVSQATFEPNAAKVIPAANLPVKKGDSWTLSFFCKIDHQPEDRTLIAGFGNSRDGREGTGRYFTKFPRGINFWVCDRDVMTDVPLDTGKWQMLTATYDGKTMRLYKNGEPIAAEEVALEDDVSQARVMPIDAWERQRRFDGEVRDFQIWDVDLPADVIKGMYESGSKG